jgi:hypothetical protein
MKKIFLAVYNLLQFNSYVFFFYIVLREITLIFEILIQIIFIKQVYMNEMNGKQIKLSFIFLFETKKIK